MSGEGSLSGLRVLITAGAAGIGLAMAKQFVAAGARVHLCDIDRAALDGAAAALADVGLTHADVADPEAVSRLFEAARASLGGLDVLVNNAGIAGPTARVEEMDLEDWRRTLDINITGQFLCARLAVPLLRAAGGGSIVNLASVAGRLGFPLRGAYAASKWAVVGFTKSLAMELGPDRIRVNALLPGIVEGERIERVIAAKAAAKNLSHEEMRQELLSAVSMRASVTGDDVAAMALFLVSEAGAKISGQAISIDGDVQVLR